MARVGRALYWIALYVLIVHLRKLRKSNLQNGGISKPLATQANTKKPTTQQSLRVKEDAVLRGKEDVFRDGDFDTNKILTALPYSEQSFRLPVQQVGDLQQHGIAQDGNRQSAHQSQPLRRTYQLPEASKSWCGLPELPVLPYLYCDREAPVYKIRMTSSLTQSLKLILLVATTAFEENRCFFVEQAPHQPRIDLTRYADQIGVPTDHELVSRSQRLGHVLDATMEDFWDNPAKRRIHGQQNNITNLYYTNMESSHLKRVMLMRMWRLLPNVQETLCSALEGRGLRQEYLAISYTAFIRDGEVSSITPQQYIDAATQAIVEHFGDQFSGVVYVATDDCGVVSEFQSLRPSWNFQSECGNAPDRWNLVENTEQTDQYIYKLLVELIGLASAKYYIGVSFADHAWLTAFMRNQRWAYTFLDDQSHHIVDECP